jgi:hypothetical protein
LLFAIDPFIQDRHNQSAVVSILKSYFGQVFYKLSGNSNTTIRVEVYMIRTNLAGSCSELLPLKCFTPSNISGSLQPFAASAPSRCLCIIQDSTEDWRHEGSEMANIHESAFVTLATSKAPHAESGCFSTPDPKYKSRIMALEDIHFGFD